MSDQIHNLQQFAASIPGMTQGKPLIMLPGKDAGIRETAAEIYKLASAQRALFFHNTLVVKLDRSSGSEYPDLVQLTPAAARSEFEKFARFGRRVKQGTTTDVLSENDAKAILACDVAREVLPNITGILHRPIPILRNGHIEILHKGYNESAGFLVDDGSILEPDTVEEAVELIESLFLDFKFQTESDKARAVAAILTPALKMGGFILGNTPIDITEAYESQTGKTYLLELRCLVYGEEPVVLAEQKGGVGSTDERLAGALLKGRPFVIMDNFRGSLDSQLLESYMTNRSKLGVRVPYFGLQFIDGSNFNIAVSSNGMKMTVDLANRASFIRLEKVPDRDFSNINGSDIKQVVETLQPRYIGAVTKIIRHWFELGRQKTNEKRHDFREWAQSLDWIVQNVFNLPPLIAGNQEAQDRAHSPAKGFVRELSILVDRGDRLGEHFRAQELANLCEANNLDIPGMTSNDGIVYDSTQKAQRIGQLMAQAFSKSDELILDQFKVSRESARRTSGAGNLFRSPRYTFERILEETAETRETENDFAI